MLWDELCSLEDIHLLGVRRPGPRPPPSLPENISIMSRRKKLSNAENLFTLVLCFWWPTECEPDIRSIWESKIKSQSKFLIISSTQFIQFLTSIGFWYFTLMSPTWSFTPHLFSWNHSFYSHQMSQYFVCCRDLLVLEMYWKLPAKSFENFAMGLLWLKLSWASSGLWKFPSLKFRTGIIRNTSGNSEGPPRICQTKWYSSGCSGINNRNDPNKKVHLSETFCPERVRELISCRAGGRS